MDGTAGGVHVARIVTFIGTAVNINRLVIAGADASVGPIPSAYVVGVGEVAVLDEAGIAHTLVHGTVRRDNGHIFHGSDSIVIVLENTVIGTARCVLKRTTLDGNGANLPTIAVNDGSVQSVCVITIDDAVTVRAIHIHILEKELLVMVASLEEGAAGGSANEIYVAGLKTSIVGALVLLITQVNKAITALIALGDNNLTAITLDFKQGCSADTEHTVARHVVSDGETSHVKRHREIDRNIGRNCAILQDDDLIVFLSVSESLGKSAISLGTNLGHGVLDYGPGAVSIVDNNVTLFHVCGGIL